MRIVIDTDSRTFTFSDKGETHTFDLYSPECFEVLSRHWLKIGWSMKYSYSFSWMGRPIIQIPEDIIRVQEVIFRVQPDVIIETGIAHGGSLIFYASLCEMMGKGRVIGIDIEIRAENRSAIEAHRLTERITMIEGNSTSTETLTQVEELLKKDEVVMVIFDSCHTSAHVSKELKAYCEFVTPDSYVIVTDGIMKDLTDVPAGEADWIWDNPTSAALDFCSQHTEFRIEQPPWPFNESRLSKNIVTYWPNAYIKRIE